MTYRATIEEPPADPRDAQLRELAPKALHYLEELLALQGDRADRDLIELQHALAESLRPSASNQAERSTSALKKGPGIFKDGDYFSICLDVELHDRVVAEFKAEKKREADAAAERERKKAERAAKNPQKIKNLADLPADSFVHVDADAKPLLALVPEDAHLELNDDGGKALVCTKPDLFRRIEKAVGTLKAADRKEKWTRVVVDALAAIANTKKVGPREVMLMVYVASQSDNLYPGPRLFVEKGSGLSVKFPKKALHEHYEGQIDFSVESLALLMKEPGPVDCFRVLMDSWVRQLENDLVESGYDWGADSDLGTICKWILERDELGFIEETKAGQKQLLEAVEAQEWYQRALAEIEGREYALPTSEAAAVEGTKPAKRKGKAGK